MYALLCDIHGNLEALEAVLNQVAGLEVICLGDVVCYGPDSLECVRRSAHWGTIIAGQFDIEMLDHNLERFPAPINGLIERVRRRLMEADDSQTLTGILQSYRTQLTRDGIMFFHGDPHDVRGYLFPEDVYNVGKLNRMFDSMERVFIGGGSHLPGLFQRKHEMDWEFTTPENGVWYDLSEAEKTIITLGSVGQPRDNDPRAAYAILNDSQIAFHRVEYDVNTTIAKIKSDPEIDDMHGDRLPHGR